MNLKRLTEPFPASDIEWRIAQCGVTADNKVWAKALAYITARAGQDRLDEVFGVLGWKVEYSQHEYIAGSTEEAAFVCRISVQNEKGEWVHKEDGAACTDIETFKGGISGAFKRCCASGFGIGRYLYGLSEIFVEATFDKQKNWNYAQTKDKKAFWWRVHDDALPAWALPGAKKQDELPVIQRPGASSAPSGQPAVQTPPPIADANKNRAMPQLDDKYQVAHGLITTAQYAEIAQFALDQKIPPPKLIEYIKCYCKALSEQMDKKDPAKERYLKFRQLKDMPNTIYNEIYDTIKTDFKTIIGVEKGDDAVA